MENGFMISGFQLQKEWFECVVEACLREVFEEKIPLGVDFEILMPVHSTLIKPTLEPGQSLNGVMVHRVFKEKPIYIRPFQEICDVSSFSIKRYRETSPDQEDDFIRHTKHGKCWNLKLNYKTAFGNLACKCGWQNHFDLVE
ncbi:hypothetical protein OS493_008698 [Desmophyllum pertusum]|uniref:Uncharacterized protein n=1 Tax=Desmophyllum pertusum TaxID=174260 RepID=A0A9X0D4U9_9CNID|nr:hypothetical protein OS493_008698 [Desmophyllum pertusum]